MKISWEVNTGISTWHCKARVGAHRKLSLGTPLRLMSFANIHFLLPLSLIFLLCVVTYFLGQCILWGTKVLDKSTASYHFPILRMPLGSHTSRHSYLPEKRAWQRCGSPGYVSMCTTFLLLKKKSERCVVQ